MNEKIEEKYDIENKINKIKNFIPNGYFIGLTKEHILLICYVIYYVINNNNNENQCIIDIGSGKGYIDRIISSIYKKRIFCIDEIKDRLKSSERLQDLLNDDKYYYLMNESIDGTINNNNNNNKSLMKSFSYKIENVNDFRFIWDKSLDFFKDNNNNNQIFKKITILSLKVCGDLIFNIIKWVIYNKIYIKRTLPKECVNKITIFIVPCCPSKGIIMKGMMFNNEPIESQIINYIKKMFEKEGSIQMMCEIRNFIGIKSYFGVEIEMEI